MNIMNPNHFEFSTLYCVYYHILQTIVVFLGLSLQSSGVNSGSRTLCVLHKNPLLFSFLLIPMRTLRNNIYETFLKAFS